MSLQSTWDLHLVPVLPPAADRFNTDPASDCVRRSPAGEIAFLVYINTAGGNTGTAKLQLQLCSAAAGTGATAVPFRWRKTATGTDVWTELSDEVVAADGITTTANEESIYELIVDNRELNESLLGATVADYDFIRLKTTEVVNDPVTGCAMVRMSKLKTEEIPHDTVMS